VSGGDFLNLLKKENYTFGGAGLSGNAVRNMPRTSATTILSFKYRDGLLVAGDRRATAGMTVMHDRADKVIDIDRHSVMAIAGSPATAFEMARVLAHSFKYYRRSQLQDLSLEGKVRALSRLLKENIPMAMQGVGAVAPIYAAFDPKTAERRIYFYDMLGAEFEVVDFATSGSGSPGIRGVLHYHNRWNTSTVSELNEEEAVVLAMRLLETAAEFDVATGGVKEKAKVFPIVKTINAAGVREIPFDRLTTLYTEKVDVPHV